MGRRRLGRKALDLHGDSERNGSKHGIGAIVLLSHEELREILRKVQAKANSKDENLLSCLSIDVKQLQFYLKNLQEKGMFSFDGSFDYSSIDELDFRRFSMDPTSIAHISNGWDTRPVLPPSQKNISKEFSSCIHRKPSSSSKRCSNPSFASSFFHQNTTLLQMLPFKKIHMELNHLTKKLMKLTS